MTPTRQPTVRRRAVLAAAVAVAGCTTLPPTGDDDGDGGGGADRTETPTRTRTPEPTECRTVTRERTDLVYEDLDTWGAGDAYTWSIDLERGGRVHVRVVTVDGARADLEIKDPDGELVLDTGPTTPLQRAYTAAESGTHYVTLTNEALITDGQWDARIEVVREVEQRVCE